MSATSPTQLSYDVFVSDGPAGAGDERMPDGAPLAWSPLSTTLDGTRCEALFASELQRSDAPTAESVTEAISRTVRRLGTRGCAGRMAQEFGDHPQAAAERMRWIRQLAAGTTTGRCRASARSRLAGPGAGRPQGMTHQETGSGDERDL
jgi:hypothetical protein